MVFLETRIQLCIIHQIRNTLKYIAYKDQKAFMRDLKRVYGAESEEIAMSNLEGMMDIWKNMPSYWITGLINGSISPPYFCYGHQIRKLIYTTYTEKKLCRHFVESSYLL